MKRPRSVTKIQAILKRDDRYDVRAYAFVNEALNFVVSSLPKNRHISGRELLDGLRKLALNRYGNMARLVLESWGIFSSEDVGEIVFNLIEAGVLARQDTDTRDDFVGVLNFKKVFDEARIEWL
ncbi:MAG: hypothetical protein Kow00107_02920 [Planctomycetota bacterium]